MPRIDITEYDNTIIGPKENTGNIVAIPINATDGPSDRWVTIYTYEDFVNIFGPKPVNTSAFGSSWEYAANLLLRKMPVCVRRITHELTEDGFNVVTKDLPKISTARTILKIKDIIGNLTIRPGDIIESLIESSDPNNRTQLIASDKGVEEPNELYVSKDLVHEVPFDSVTELEEYTQTLNDEELKANLSFADVIDNGKDYPFIPTNNEWVYTGKTPNSHYKAYAELDMDSDIPVNNEVVTDVLAFYDKVGSSKEKYGIGDFFLMKTGTNKYRRIDYTSVPQKNNNLYGDISSPYIEGDLLTINTNAINTDVTPNVPVFNKNTFIPISLGRSVNAYTYSGLRIFANETELNAFKDYLKPKDTILVYDSNSHYGKFSIITDDNQVLNLAYVADTIEDIKDLNEYAYSFILNDFFVYHIEDGKWVSTNTSVFENEKLDGNTYDFSKHLFKIENKYQLESVESVNDLPKKVTLDTPLCHILVDDGNESNPDNGVYCWNTKAANWVKNNNADKSDLNRTIINTYSKDSLTKIGKFIVVPWVNTKELINTKRYCKSFNWKVYDSDKDENGKDVTKFFKHIYWANSNRAINTTDHYITTGAGIKLNTITLTGIANAYNTTLKPVVNSYYDIGISDDHTNNRLVSGKVSIKSISLTPIKIYSLRILQVNEDNKSTLLYNAGIERLNSVADNIASDSALKFVLSDGTELPLSNLRPKLDMSGDDMARWYIELPSGASLIYNKNLSGVQISTQIAIFDNDIQFNLYESANGKYEVNFSTEDTMEVKKHALPEVEDTTTFKELTEDMRDIPISDGKGNFNLFRVKYVYPGSNGNLYNARIKTIKNQGIYIYIYKGNQYLERIELCNFRISTTNGRIKVLDIDINKFDIWRMVLEKFGIYLDTPTTKGNYTTSLPTPIYGNYVDIELNNNILDYESTDYIDGLLAQTGSQISSLREGNDTLDEHIIHEVPKCFEPLKDKYRYDIKFIANGGYLDDLILSSEITKATAGNDEVRLIEDAMLDVAETRKDCVTYLDAPIDVAVEDVPFYFEHISSSYAAAYDPWCNIRLATGGTKWMPPSFVMLYTHAKSIANGNKMYLPPAGVKRALVPEIIQTNHDLPSSYLTDWQNNEAPQFINPIIWINGYDYTIYGQKTLYNMVNQSKLYSSTLQNLNVRLVANEIKKLIFKTCIELSFDLNALMMWNEFKSKMDSPLLEMQGEGVITDYDVIMGTETMTDADLNSGHVCGTVRAAIVTAGTDWDISFEIQPNRVTFYDSGNNSSTYTF